MTDFGRERMFRIQDIAAADLTQQFSIFNDSKAAHGSKLDRHQHIGGGEVGARGLVALISHPKLAHAAYYLETPGMEEGWDRLNVDRTIQLAQGNLKLKPLPAESPGVPKPAKRVVKAVAKVAKIRKVAKVAPKKPVKRAGAVKKASAASPRRAGTAKPQRGSRRQP